jgi:hypothetical protein
LRRLRYQKGVILSLPFEGRCRRQRGLGIK